MTSADDTHDHRSRLLAHVALLAVGLLQRVTPAISPQAWWVLLVILALLLLPSRARRQPSDHDLDQWLGYTTLVVVAGFVAASLARLVFHLQEYSDGDALLEAAGALWISNILVFATLYWRLDAGGPRARRGRSTHYDHAAFLFPQMALPGGPGSWKPGFVDYLFVAFNTSTAFSPTDVPVLSPWAKVAMMAQASIGLGTIALIAARAVNILAASPASLPPH